MGKGQTVRIIDKVGDGLAIPSLTDVELLDVQGQAVDLLQEILDARTHVGNHRFEVQKEMDDEPVYVTDNSTDPDNEDHEVITISPHWGTPRERASLARMIVAIMIRKAEVG